VGAHRRNIGPMNEAPRCGARTRAGTPCQAPAISGKARCRMHGGKKSGAPKGNRNAFSHGAYTKVVIEREARVRTLCQRLRHLTSAQELTNVLAITAEPSLPNEKPEQ
jgi:glucans biosynthesis protein